MGTVAAWRRGALGWAAGVAMAAAAWAAPTSVDHAPTSAVFGEPGGVTQREPDVPREDEPVTLFFRVGFQFTYDKVAVYYTTDGSEPGGAFGTPTGTTAILTNPAVEFVRNQTIAGQGTYDWWKVTLPAGARGYAQNIRYKISAWRPFDGPEVFASGGAAFTYVNKLAWPGAGAGQADPSAGYPPVSFWKEEAVIGNTYCAGMLDQNGTVYDLHFPTPGGVQGVGTRNEGYVDGLDTFPPGLPQGWRGQMHLNQAMPGIRIDGLTHWLSNPGGVSFTGVSQAYHPQSNTVTTTQRLLYGGNDLSVTQIDFAPMFAPGDPLQFPVGSGQPQRHLAVKRMLLRNNGPSAETVNVYFYLDPALNGGDGYDAMFADPARGLCAFDKTRRTVTGTGTGFSDPNEYNPTTFSGYDKNIALYLGAAMKSPAAVGGAGGVRAGESWRDTSGDQGQGWIGQKLTLPPGVEVEVDICLAGGWLRPDPITDPIPASDGVYDGQVAPALDWFLGASMGQAQALTDAYWAGWLAEGVSVDIPEPGYDELFDRSLLATALHVDGVNGGVIAGFHNGAYPYVWPRDAVYAAVTLARTGHVDEAAGVYEWMRETTYRDFEPWGRKGFWKQKYTTDGYVIWGAPQIDETAVFPWGLRFQYQVTGDAALLAANVEQVRDAVRSMTSDSSDSRLRFEDAVNLVYSNNVWEDSYDTFNYSNANVVRGLEDARAVFGVLGLAGDAADAAFWRDRIKGGLDARLDWNGENTDISQLGICYPFEVYPPADARAARVIDRINGVAADRFGQVRPLVNFTGEHQDTVNRYWGDSYWNGGPWFLSTLWYGLYYAQRQDVTAGTADIDNHKRRLDLCIDRLGPAGLGAEQIAYGTGPGASLLYPGQQDYKLQAAWPNAWESMSTLADAVMKFLDYRPDAPAKVLRLRPKLPFAWPEMTFRGLKLVDTPAGLTHRVDARIAADDGAGLYTHGFTNRTGHAVSVETVIRIPAGATAFSVQRNGAAWPFSFDAAIGAVTIAATPLETGPGAVTTFTVSTRCPADLNGDGLVDFADYLEFLNLYDAGDPAVDFNQDGLVDFADYLEFLNLYDAGC